MYPINALTEHFEAVEILGIPALFTTLRVDRETVPKGMYAYDMKTNEEDWLFPDLLGRHVTVDHYGTVLTASPIPLPENGYRDLAPGDFVFDSGADQLTVAEFEDKCFSRPPSARPQHHHHKPRAVSSPAR